MIKVGDRVVVHGLYQKAVISEIIQENSYETILILDWGEFGKSRVKLHDQNKIWFIYEGAN